MGMNDTRRNVWTNQYLMVMYAVSQEIRVVVVLYIANIEDLRMIKSPVCNRYLRKSRRR